MLSLLTEIFILSSGKSQFIKQNETISAILVNLGYQTGIMFSESVNLLNKLT